MALDWESIVDRVQDVVADARERGEPFLEQAKKTYFELEDRYYRVLDSLQPKLPVYSVIDPLDKVLPSFGILLGLVGAVLFFGLLGVGSSLVFGDSVSLSVTFNDSSGIPVRDVSVSIAALTGNTATQTKVTNASGTVQFSLPAGEYEVSVSESAFEPFSQTISLSSSKSQIFTLTAKGGGEKSRVLLIQDASGKIIGTTKPLPISLSFSCQTGTAPLPQTVQSGNVQFLLPGSCAGLSVTVSAPGYITKTQVILGDTTTLLLQNAAALSEDENTDETIPNPTGGIVEASVTTVSGVAIEGAQVKLYRISSTGASVLSNQVLSDASGFSLFESVAPGSYILVVTQEGFQSFTSDSFSVIAGETLSLSAKLVVSSTDAQLLVKILNASNQLPVEGAVVTLFVSSSSNTLIEYGSYTADGNGVVSEPVADFNGNAHLVVSHDSFVTFIGANKGIVIGNGAPIPILLDPVQAANPNGSIPNAVVVDVKVVDEIGLPILGAEVRVFSPDVNGVMLGVKSTNSSGVARFTNLPEGTYQAAASTNDLDGISAPISGKKGQIVTLPVSLEIGSALVEVSVRSEQNIVIADAQVKIIRFGTTEVLATGVTNAQGIVTLGVPTGNKAFVEVSKADYLPFSSVAFDIIKDNTHKISIEVSLTSASPTLGMALNSIYHISSSGAQTLASSLSAGETYAFHFTTKTPSLLSNVKSVIRLNGNAFAYVSTHTATFTGAEAAKGGVSFYTTFNPDAPFSPENSVSSGTASNVMVNALGDISAGAFEVIVFVKINPASIPNVDKLLLNYQSQSASQSSGLYAESFTIGQPLPAQGDFGYVFFLSQIGSSQKVQVSPNAPAPLEQNQSYTLEYAVT
ncbi:MAG: carboxypeptidase-like regulatory domain-containing protein, partial [archaeon]